MDEEGSLVPRNQDPGLLSKEGMENKGASLGSEPLNETQNEEKVRRLNFSGENWIDIDIKLTEMTIHNHAKVFNKSATFYFGTWSNNSMKSQDKLHEFCEAFSQEKIRSEEVFGRIAIYLNPLNNVILPRIGLKYLHETITSVKNPFIIAKKNVEINADFLKLEEKNKILQEGSLEKFDQVDYLKVPLFNPLLEPGLEISTLLARLFCGIADKRANITYTFHDGKGDEFRVIIDGVIFEDALY